MLQNARIWGHGYRIEDFEQNTQAALETTTDKPENKKNPEASKQVRTGGTSGKI